MKRFEDWLKQADEDLKAARDNKKIKHLNGHVFKFNNPLRNFLNLIFYI
jgi:hypothetical protein